MSRLEFIYAISLDELVRSHPTHERSAIRKFLGVNLASIGNFVIRESNYPFSLILIQLNNSESHLGVKSAILDSNFLYDINAFF